MLVECLAFRVLHMMSTLHIMMIHMTHHKILFTIFCKNLHINSIITD